MTKNTCSRRAKTPPTLNTEYIRILMNYRRLDANEVGRRAQLDGSTARKAINNLEPISREAKRAVLRVLARALRRKTATLCIDRVAA